MARILTGIQSSGKPHLGNVLGAIQPAIELSGKAGNDSFLFIADLHSLTTIKHGITRTENTIAVAATWLACGLNTDQTTFYRQSDVPEVCELAWYLGCFTPFPMLANAHSFKDKSEKLADVNAGLFTYPVLMAADILLYEANLVPVGKDQKQHLEMTRDMAHSFNAHYGDVLVIPEAKIEENVMLVPGTDGQKMSKSYNNTIDVFLPEKEMKKQIMSIVTDSTPIEEPKNPDKCNVYKLYALLANDDEILSMRENYLAGGFGYGHAKTALYEILLRTFARQRTAYLEYMSDPALIEKELKKGAEKARSAGAQVLKKVRKALGYH